MGNVGITLSSADPAGANMLQIFRERGFKESGVDGILELGNVNIFVIPHLIVPGEKYQVPPQPNPYPADYDTLASRYDLDYFVVASRHWSESGTPCLTVHATGNFGKAMYGGRNRELQGVPANPMRNVFMELIRDPPKGYEVSLEATHHSPTQFSTPMFFAELGSSELQWGDGEAARYLVDAILKGVSSNARGETVIGFGGGHYCPIFTSMERETAFGHIAAKYAIDLLNDDLVRQMAEKTADRPSAAVLDEGLKGHQRKKIEVSLRKLNIETKET